MRLVVFLPIIIVSLAVYFTLELYILPQQYLEREQPQSIPQLTISVSNNEILLGESFEVELYSQNIGDISDALLVSVSFPELKEINDEIKIVSYDFTESPHIYKEGDKIGFEYSPLQKKILAKYSLIEAYTRPAKTGNEYHMVLDITPTRAGDFIFYVKAITFPHLTPLSHFPSEGSVDQQGELVKVFSVNVN